MFAVEMGGWKIGSELGFASELVFFAWMNGEDDAGLDDLYWVYRSTGSCLPGPFSVY